VLPVPIVGTERKSSIAGSSPKRRVRPGCTFQHEGRAHQTSRLRTSINAAIPLSNALKERFSGGVMKKMSGTAQILPMSASLKNQ